MTSELNELVKNLSGNNGEQILETLSTLEALVSSASIQNLKNDVAELKEVAHIFGSQLTHNLEQVQQINEHGLANFDNANNALTHNITALNSISSNIASKLDSQIEALENISEGFANSIARRLQDPALKEKIGIELGLQVDNATSYLVNRFRENLDNEKIQFGITEQVSEMLKIESENLQNELRKSEEGLNLVRARFALNKESEAKTLAIENKNLKAQLASSDELAQKFVQHNNALLRAKEESSFSLSKILLGLAVTYLVLKPFVDPFLSKFL